MDQAAADYEANGGSPIVGEQLRHSFTGNERLAYERTRLSMLSQEYPTFLAKKLTWVNSTEDEGERADWMKQVVVKNSVNSTGVGVLTKVWLTNTYTVLCGR